MTYIGLLLSLLDKEHAYSREERVRLEEIFVAYNGLLYGYIYQMVGNAEQALDFMQESFVRLLTAKKHFSDKDHIKNYLFRIARNLCVTTLREKKLKQHASFENIEAKGYAFRDEAGGQSEELQKNEISAFLNDFIKSRPERERTILTLKKMEGMKYEDLRDITGLSVRQLKRIVKAELDTMAALFEKRGIRQMEDLI